jgi:hypothetical protein
MRYPLEPSVPAGYEGVYPAGVHRLRSGAQRVCEDGPKLKPTPTLATLSMACAIALTVTSP